MKYLFLRNKIELKKNILKFYIIQILLVVIYIIINKSVIKNYSTNEYFSLLGLKSIKDSYIIYILIKITSYLIIFHITTKVFVESIIKNIQYIILRINKKKWILYEISNFILYIIIMRSIYNILIYLSLHILGIKILFSTFIITYIKDTLFFITLLLSIISIANISCLNNYKKIIVIFPITVIILSLFINLANIPIVFLLLSVIILIIINTLLFAPTNFYTKYSIK